MDAVTGAQQQRHKSRNWMGQNHMRKTLGFDSGRIQQNVLNRLDLASLGRLGQTDKHFSQAVVPYQHKGFQKQQKDNYEDLMRSAGPARREFDRIRGYAGHLGGRDISGEAEYNRDMKLRLGIISPRVAHLRSLGLIPSHEAPLRGVRMERHARNILKQKATLLQLARTSQNNYEVNYRDINESDMEGQPTASVLWRTGQDKKPFASDFDTQRLGQRPFKLLDRDGNEAYWSDMGLTSSSTHEALGTQKYHTGYEWLPSASPAPALRDE